MWFGFWADCRSHRAPESRPPRNPKSTPTILRATLPQSVIWKFNLAQNSRWKSKKKLKNPNLTNRMSNFKKIFIEEKNLIWPKNSNLTQEGLIWHKRLIWQKGRFDKKGNFKITSHNSTAVRYLKFSLAENSRYENQNQITIFEKF